VSQPANLVDERHSRRDGNGRTAVAADQGPRVDLLVRVSDGFTRRLTIIQPGQWTAPTPCAEWDVRALVNHVVGANRRYTMLLHGAAADEVDRTRTTDHLGHDPAASFLATTAELHAAFREPGAMARIAHHPVGDRTGGDLLAMRVLDVTVHTWDLARAIGADKTLDDDAVAFSLSHRDNFEAGRQQGTFDPPSAGTLADLPAQARLLHLSGRPPGAWPPAGAATTSCP
jgi:uncharacterized protein (TIGR03086 family)